MQNIALLFTESMNADFFDDLKEFFFFIMAIIYIVILVILLYIKEKFA